MKFPNYTSLISNSKIRINGDTLNLFLEYERLFSEEFLKFFNLTNFNFNEKEYIFFSEIFKNTKLFNEIISTIVELLNYEKIPIILKYLIFWDFIFSAININLANPNDFVFKINRSTYLKKIFLRAEINFLVFGIDWQVYVKLHKKLLMALVSENIFKKEVLKLKINDLWETTIFFKLNVKNLNFEDNNFFGQSPSPFYLIKINDSYYSVSSYRNIWKAKRKKKEMESVRISYSGVIAKNKIGLVLSNHLLKINNNLILKYTNDLLRLVECSSIKEYFEKLKKIANDKKFIKTWKTETGDLASTDVDALLDLEKSINRVYSQMSSIFQKLIILNLLEKDIFDVCFYLPSFGDNRPRVYWATLLSPTFSVVLRYLYEFAVKKEFCNLEESIFYRQIINFKWLVVQYNLDERNSYILIILFIEVGKFHIKETMASYTAATESIVILGIQVFNEKKFVNDFEDNLYLNKIFNLIQELLTNNEINHNTIIFKDATASGLQNYGILFGYKKESLPYLNIDNPNWCDTYKYLIEKFLQNEENNLKKRKYWKSTIMTVPYNSTWFSCFKKFIKELSKDGIVYCNLQTEEKEKIKKIHQEFYKKIKYNIKKEFYLSQNSKKLKKFKYFKFLPVSKKEYKINYKRKRDKYIDIVYMIINDPLTTERALEANNMHYLDAKLVEFVLTQIEVLPIHDCFGVRLCELHLLMDIINSYYAKKVGLNTYSIHIIF